MTAFTGAVDYAVSTQGTLIYVTGTPTQVSEPSSMVWVDRAGRETSIKAPERAYAIPRISPDGTRLVYAAIRGGTSQLYLRPLDQMEATPIEGAEDGTFPFFSPDGQWLGFFADGKLKKIAIDAPVYASHRKIPFERDIESQIRNLRDRRARVLLEKNYTL